MSSRWYKFIGCYLVMYILHAFRCSKTFKYTRIVLFQPVIDSVIHLCQDRVFPDSPLILPCFSSLDFRDIDDLKNMIILTVWVLSVGSNLMGASGIRTSSLLSIIKISLIAFSYSFSSIFHD